MYTNDRCLGPEETVIVSPNRWPCVQWLLSKHEERGLSPPCCISLGSHPFFNGNNIIMESEEHSSSASPVTADSWLQKSTLYTLITSVNFNPAYAWQWLVHACMAILLDHQCSGSINCMQQISGVCPEFLTLGLAPSAWYVELSDWVSKSEVW